MGQGGVDLAQDGRHEGRRLAAATLGLHDSVLDHQTSQQQASPKAGQLLQLLLPCCVR